jgi:LmbE family N-acetylglucosaminyl deacetylase
MVHEGMNRLFPVLLPHFNFQRNSLCFISKDFWSVACPPDQIKVLKACNGKRRISDILKISPRGSAILKSADRSGLLTWIQPMTRTIHRTQIRRWLVLAPHQDDAALSLGGFFLKEGHKADIHILTIASKSIFSTLLPLSGDSKWTSRIRNSEDDCYARTIGAVVHRGNQEEELLTVMQKRGLSLREAAPQIWEPPTVVKVERFRRVIERQIRLLKPHVLFVPLGLGNHIEHVATQRAVLSIMKKSPELLRRRKVYFYEELPYVFRKPKSLPKKMIEFRKQGVFLTKKMVNISKQLEGKLLGISIYRSQAYANFIDAARKHSARLGKNENRKRQCFYERLWVVKSFSPIMLSDKRRAE